MCYAELAQKIPDFDPILKARTYRYAAIAYTNAVMRYQTQGEDAKKERVLSQIRDVKTQILLDSGISCTMDTLHGIRLAWMDVQRLREGLHQSHGVVLDEIETHLANTTPQNLNVAWGVEKINALFLENFDLYKKVIEQFTAEIFKIIGQPPCAYAWAAVGSLGKLMSSSKSDLDLILLIEDDSQEAFFKLYAALLSLCVIDFGETPLVRIRTDEMKWMYDFCEQDNKEGFSIDVGGIPIDYGAYQMLGTPKKIIAMLDGIKAEHFSAIDTSLYCPRLFIGVDDKLLSEFQTLNHERFLRDIDICSSKELTSSLEQFHCVLDEEMYIRHEWLRHFVEGLVRLARWCKIPSVNPCEIILKLQSAQLITPQLAGSLFQLYFLVSYFMLRNYQFHNAQVQQILLHSQLLPSNETITVSDGHQIRTPKGFFQHKAVVRKIPGPGERYHLLRNEKVISQEMPWIHQVLYLQSGFRQLLRHFLARHFESIRILPSLEMDPKLLFEFAARENHLSKNGVNKIKHNTNSLYRHLFGYFERLQGKNYMANEDGHAVCLFVSSGVALISTLLKLFHWEAANRIADQVMDSLKMLCNLQQVLDLDRRLPTLYAQFFFFKARLLLFNVTPNQVHAQAVLKEAECYINKAKMIRDLIDKSPQGIFDDAFNDGFDRTLFFLHGTNLPKLASGKKEDLTQALMSYTKALGQSPLTDVACYSKMVHIRLRLYPFALSQDKKQLLETIETECQIALKLAQALESSITAVFYNTLGEVRCHQSQFDGAREMFEKSCQAEETLNRNGGVFLQVATGRLKELSCKAEEASPSGLSL